GDLHHARLSLQGGRWIDDQLPLASVDTVHAGQRADGPGSDADGLRARDRRGISILQLRGCVAFNSLISRPSALSRLHRLQLRCAAPFLPGFGPPDSRYPQSVEDL